MQSSSSSPPPKGALPGFLGATEIIDHLQLYERLEAGKGDAADAKALLRARLTDINGDRVTNDGAKLVLGHRYPRCPRFQ